VSAICKTSILFQSLKRIEYKIKTWQKRKQKRSQPRKQRKRWLRRSQPKKEKKDNFSPRLLGLKESG